MADYYVQNPGGNDSGAGTSGDPWLTLQKALDTWATHDTIYCTGGETISATIDDDFAASSSAFQYNQIIATNSSWEIDGTTYDIDANSAATYGLNLARGNRYVYGIKVSNAISHGINESAALFNINLHKCAAVSCGGAGFYVAGMNSGLLYQCSAIGNTSYGFLHKTGHNIKCLAINNGNYGFYTYVTRNTLIRCVAHNNTGSGAYLAAEAILIYGGVYDGNGTRNILAPNTSALIAVKSTNSAIGFEHNNNGSLLDDLCLFNNNTANFSLGTGVRYTMSGQSLLTGNDGYVDRSADDFSTSSSSTNRNITDQVGIVDGTKNLSYESAGLVPEADSGGGGGGIFLSRPRIHGV